jgi:mono/diheme cytochrome c family protein
MMRMMLYPFACVCAMVLCSQAAYADEEASIEHGRYLATAADCGACHTIDDTKPFAGGLKIGSPVGNIYSTNITPDKKTGIGDYRYEDFERAVRQGIAKDGSILYPAMPYPSYSRLSDNDVRDLFAYFKNGVQPQVNPNHATDIPWPLNMRWPLHIWKWLFASDSAEKPKSTDPQWLRGAYLVQSLGHCGACHTPRGVAFQEKALDHTDADYLTGGKIDNWYAPALTGDYVFGLGKWSQQDIVDFLDTGKNAHTTAFGPMKEVITKSTHQMTDEDLNAIAVYLKSLPGKKNDTVLIDEPTTAQALAKGDTRATGAQTYVDSCAACHRSDGKGYSGIFPPLAHNPALLSDDPSSVISMILLGGAQPVTESDITGITMPDFAGQLSNKQVAEVATFIRNSWGNHASPVTEKDVKKIRESIMSSQKK